MTRILIAEDEPRIAAFLEKGLRANGFTTLVADTGPLAASMARDSDFDLVILDLGLPGMDGQHVLRQIRQRGERDACLLQSETRGIRTPAHRQKHGVGLDPPLVERWVDVGF